MSTMAFISSPDTYLHDVNSFDNQPATAFRSSKQPNSMLPMAFRHSVK